MNRFFSLLLAASLLFLAHARAETGDDVRRVLAAANDGKPLRCVLIGGSITQAGNGWIEPWLRERFPKSAVTVINSGMSATGSSLGIFRIDRDVIAHQPDLVAIEYCVNDGGGSDEETIRNMESLVVRLKSLPNPPAIVILEAAAQKGVNLERHRKVAKHYGLLEVDFQAAVDRRLKETGEPWDAYFSDSVHPNPTGHRLYSETLALALEPLASGTGAKALKGTKGIRASKAAALPKPLSTLPLILDGRIVPISGQVGSWKRESSLPFWWDSFFMGVLNSSECGASLTIPVRGTTFGVFHAMDKSYGCFFASVDEGVPRLIDTNSRGGYNSPILARDLPAREHRIQVVLPAKANDPAGAFLNGPVKLGYLLVAGSEKASSEVSPAGPFGPEALKELQYREIPPQAWKWAGPYIMEPLPGAALPKAKARPLAKDGGAFLEILFPPENDNVEWKPVEQAAGPIDFRKLTGSELPAVAYAVTEIPSEKPARVFLAVTPDYFAKVWLNGELVSPAEQPSRSAKEPILIPVQLKAGSNRLMVKVASGSGGFTLSTAVFQ